MDFITKHLINKIGVLISEKQKTLNHDSFVYFDKPIKIKTKYINRVNRHNFYYQNEILPQIYWLLEGKQLIDIFESVKHNNFFVYKTIKGKDYKTRIKK